MIIDESFKGLIKQKNGDYIFIGNINSDESIRVLLDGKLIVSGSLKSGGTIFSDRGICSGVIVVSKKGSI